MFDGNKIKDVVTVDVIFLQLQRFFSAIGKLFCPLKFCNQHNRREVHYFVHLSCYADNIHHILGKACVECGGLTYDNKK